MTYARTASIGFVLAAAFALVGCGGGEAAGAGAAGSVAVDESRPDGALALSKKLQEEGPPPPVVGRQNKRHARRRH